MTLLRPVSMSEKNHQQVLSTASILEQRKRGKTDYPYKNYDLRGIIKKSPYIYAKSRKPVFKQVLEKGRTFLHPAAYGQKAELSRFLYTYEGDNLALLALRHLHLNNHRLIQSLYHIYDDFQIAFNNPFGIIVYNKTSTAQIAWELEELFNKIQERKAGRNIDGSDDHLFLACALYWENQLPPYWLEVDRIYISDFWLDFMRKELKLNEVQIDQILSVFREKGILKDEKEYGYLFPGLSLDYRGVLRFVKQAYLEHKSQKVYETPVIQAFISDEVIADLKYRMFLHPTCNDRAVSYFACNLYNLEHKDPIILMIKFLHQHYFMFGFGCEDYGVLYGKDDEDFFEERMHSDRSYILAYEEIQKLYSHPCKMRYRAVAISQKFLKALEFYYAINIRDLVDQIRRAGLLVANYDHDLAEGGFVLSYLALREYVREYFEKNCLDKVPDNFVTWWA